nr:hypothetical protein [Leptospira yasudae]
MKQPSRQSHTTYTLGEAVRNKQTGQEMFVDVTWDGKIPCVYFDPTKQVLVKVEVSFEDLEKRPETVRLIHHSKYIRIAEYELATS